MADKVQLSDKKIHFSIGGDEYSGNAIEVNGKEVGGIAYDEENNEIQGIKINPQYRRKGIAKYAIKKLFENNPKIDNVYVRATPDAKKFWQSVGVEFVAGSYNEDAGLWEGNLKRKIVISMAKGGFLGKGEMFWKKLTSSKKMEFLYDNFTPEITPRSQELLVTKAYNFLPKNVKIKLCCISSDANVSEYGGKFDKGGSMATGGGVGRKKRVYELLDETNDYSEVDKKDIPKSLAEKAFEYEWDDADIETHINKHLISVGYEYDSSNYLWKKKKMASGGKIDGVGKGSEWAFWAGLLGLGVLSYFGINKK